MKSYTGTLIPPEAIRLVRNATGCSEPTAMENVYRLARMQRGATLGSFDKNWRPLMEWVKQQGAKK